MSETEKSQNERYYFISYCRQEVTFADSFSRELEKRGIRTWADFKNLTPGTPWQGQLDDGVKNAEAVLLIVSKESMKSAAVKDEWTKALKWKKRIILIIFEPYELPSDLKAVEWEDFTGNFRKAMDRLTFRLSRSKQEMEQGDQQKKATPPRNGKRLPAEVKWLIGLNIPLFFSAFLINYAPIDSITPNPGYSAAQIFISVAFLILYIFSWTPAIWHIFHTTWRIFNRSHDAEKYRNALNGMIMTNLVAIVFSAAHNSLSSIIPLSIPILLSIFLYFILISDGVYRWAGPTGVIIRFKSPEISGHENNNLPLHVGIECASQDRMYAEELKSALIKAGHHVIENLEEAKVVLPLMSVFKTDSIFDPQSKVIFPVLLQRCNAAENLSRVQWVDLRHGKRAMEGVAHLLDEPHELMRVLGVLPVRTTIIPFFVRLAINFYLIPIVLGTLGLFTSLVDPGDHAILDVFLLLGSIVGSLIIQRFLKNRKMNFLPLLSYKIAVGLYALVAIYVTIDEVTGSMNAVAIPVMFTYLAAYWIPFSMLFVKEVRMWLPGEVKANINR